MIRTQIQLTEQQYESLKNLAVESGRSLADLTRESVELYLGSRIDRGALTARAMKAFGKHSSGAKNVSRNHDRYLAEAFRK